MLTILADPAGIAGRSRHPWRLDLTLQENIELHLAAGGECELLLNGCKIDPLTDPRLDLPPSSFDSAIIVQRPAGVESAIYALYAVLVVAAVAIITMPKAPGVPAASVAKQSSNNSLTGQTNVARAYQAIPDAFGYRRVWPDLIQPSTVEYINSVKFVTEWLCISRGRGTITSVQYAETPIGDIDGASYEIFEPVGGAYPEFGTTTLLDVMETFESAEVNGQELPYAEPFSVVSTAAQVSAAIGATTFGMSVSDGSWLDELKSVAPSGTAQIDFLYSANSSNEQTNFSQTCSVLGYSVSGSTATFTFGSAPWEANVSSSTSANITPAGAHYTTMGPYTLPVSGSRIRWNTVFLRGLNRAVQVRTDWWKIDAEGVEIAGTREQRFDTYADNTYDERAFTKEVTPAAGAGRYRIQFTRLTAAGDDTFDVAKLEEVYAVRHFPTKILPGVTVIRVTTKATNQATGFSDRKFNLRWQRHVRAFDSTAVSPSRNFARALAHLWTIAGNDIGQLDLAKFAAINAELGEASPLLRFDGSLDDRDMSLGERVQLIANHARCTVWRDGLRWTVTREQAQAYPDLQLDYRNLAASGDSAIGYASHLPASNDGVELEFVDETSQSKKAYIRLNISSGAVVESSSGNPRKVQLPGCTTYSQAMNRAQLEARRLLFQRVTVNDTALADGGALGIGALVKWIDPNDFAGDDGLQAGEVVALFGDVIRTSEPLNWQGAQSGRIVFTGTDGRQLGPAVTCEPVPGGVRLASPPPGLFVADEGRQCGSRYAFGVGLTSAELESAGLYTVSEIKPASDGTVSLAFANYDGRMFEAD